MGVFPALPPEYETFIFAGGAALARRDAADAVRAALEAGTLYAWAARQSGREAFAGRGTAYGVTLGPARIVVRHSRRGGALAGLLRDRFLGPPRFLREVAMAHHLARAGIATPAVVAAVMYPATIGHRADVATGRVDGRDLGEIFFGDAPPDGTARAAILRAVGAMVRRLHDSGFVHPDLQLRNVLVATPGTAPQPHGPTVWLLDVDTCRAVRPGDTATRRRNLARFARSWEKFNRLRGPRLTDADRTAFSSGYADRA